MFTTIEDFKKNWLSENESTLKIFRALRNES